MNKYHNKPVEIDGFKFDSQKEALRWNELKLLERAGIISNLVAHPVYIIQEAFDYYGTHVRAIMYEADFSYIENGRIIAEDVKSAATKTSVFKLKQKMFWKTHPEIELRIIE